MHIPIFWTWRLCGSFFFYYYSKKTASHHPWSVEGGRKRYKLLCHQIRQSPLWTQADHNWDTDAGWAAHRQSIKVNCLSDLMLQRATCIHVGTSVWEIQLFQRVYSPMYRGGLFSMKAAIPSCLSRVGMTWKERGYSWWSDFTQTMLHRI